MSEFSTELDSATIYMDDRMDREIAKLLRQTQFSIAVAEAVSAGYVSQHISRYLNAPSLWIGGVVCPSSLAMVQWGGVEPSMIKERGMGHPDVVKQMLAHLVSTTGADIALVTAAAIGGDEMSLKKPAAVAVGLMAGGVEKVKMFQISGHMDAIQEKSGRAALMILKQWLMVYVTETKEKTDG